MTLDEAKAFVATGMETVFQKLREAGYEDIVAKPFLHRGQVAITLRAVRNGKAWEYGSVIEYLPEPRQVLMVFEMALQMRLPRDGLN